MGENFESLIANSPFVGQTASKSATHGSKKADGLVEINYELKGILIKDGIKAFNIYNPVSNKYKWIKQGDSRGQVIIDSFDEHSKTLYFHTPGDQCYAVRLKSALNDLNLGITFK
jgi:hypothetical protein